MILYLGLFFFVGQCMPRSLERARLQRMSRASSRVSGDSRSSGAASNRANSAARNNTAAAGQNLFVGDKWASDAQRELDRSRQSGLNEPLNSPMHAQDNQYLLIPNTSGGETGDSEEQGWLQQPQYEDEEDGPDDYEQVRSMSVA